MDKKKPTKLYIFDFDGTLINSPHEHSTIDGVPARERYDQWLIETGQPKRKWLGWWGRPETLIPPIFGQWDEDGELIVPDSLLNHELAQKVREVQEDPEILSVLMTGRHIKMVNKKRKEHVCKTILDAYGLVFDRYYYGTTGQPTINFKITTIQNLLQEFPKIQHVEIWEDRHPHTSEFWNFIKYYKKLGKLNDGKVYQVDGYSHGDMPENM